MRTESEMNNMNDTKVKIRRRNMRRRILASVCAVAIALLQCAVIVTIGTEDAYAAGSVDITVVYKDESTAKKSGINLDSIDKNGSKEYTIEGTDPPETIKISGPTIKKILDSCKASSGAKKVVVNGTTINSSDFSSAFVVTKVEGDSDSGYKYKLYNGQDTPDGVKSGQTVSKMEVNRTNVSAVEFDKNPTPDKTDPSVGDTVTISYKLKVDEFLKNSDGYSEAEATKLKWTSSSSSVTLNTVETSGLNGSLDAQINSPVTSAKITVTGESIYNISAEVTISGKEKDNDILHATVSGVKNKKYTGKAVTQSGVQVVLDGVTLTEGTDYTLSYKNNVKPGTATMIVTGKGKYKNSKPVDFTITKEATKSTTKKTTRKTTKYKPGTGTYRTYATRSTLSGGATVSTGTTVPNVTYAPDRTITVKEVFLGQQIQDEPQEQPTPADMMDAAADDMMDDSSTDWAEDEYTDIDFGPMAGSAAVAVGACGAGIVGRIRRFKVDTAAQVIKEAGKSLGGKK